MPCCIPYIFPGLQVFVSWQNKHRVIPFPSAQERIPRRNWEEREGKKKIRSSLPGGKAPTAAGAGEEREFLGTGKVMQGTALYLPDY